MSAWYDVLAKVRENRDTVLSDAQTTWTGPNFYARVSGGVKWLDALGAPVGVPIVSLLAPSLDSMAISFAAAITRRPTAPLSTRLTAHELQACITPMGSKLILVDREYLDHARDAAAPDVVVAVPEFESSAEDVRDLAGPEDPPVLMHTSGTTGLPKLIRRTPVHPRPSVDGPPFHEMLLLGPGDVYATGSPMNHVAGLSMMVMALNAGAHVAMFGKFGAENWNRLGRLGLTHVTLVPTMLDILVEDGVLPLPTLKFINYGAAPMPLPLLLKIMEQLPDIDFFMAYGQTEAGSLTALTVEDHRKGRKDPRLLTSVGRALPGITLKIDTPGADGVGEVCAQGPGFGPNQADGWLHTGDLGCLDAEGFLHLAGRVGDMIIRGGENIHPAEVERVIEAHPAIREVAVLGVPDRRWGEIVGACYVLHDSADPPSDEELTAYARRSLAGFKAPALWRRMAELPRNAAGKVLRKSLIAEFLARDATPA
jgi:acyl-CoA synthetase (AMP-forming)/AMP-acid ligase II